MPIFGRIWMDLSAEGLFWNSIFGRLERRRELLVEGRR
jgi:hypothetical protein